MKKKSISNEAIIENAKKFNLSEFAVKVLMKRNLWKNDEGEIIELPEDMFKRTAKVIAEVENSFDTDKKDIKKLEKEFFSMLSTQDFLANRPLKNAGREYPYQQFAACYVFPIQDSLSEIFKILERAAFIQKWDAAAGIDYSVLRPRGDQISTTGGTSSGAVSFMTLFDKVSEVISDGSLRRGANMGVLRIDHPDVEEFIDAKNEPGVLEYFNISVGITDKFMKAVINDETYPLINPRNNKEVKRLRAREMWEKIIKSAWESAEPGLIFLDEIERKNPTPKVGKMTAVNLCGEQPLLPWESCNLGNIKLTNFIIDKNHTKEIDWDRLGKIVRLGVRFLDNTIEANHYFYKEIEDIVKNGNRKIGLGIMAFADLLMELGIPYNSEEGLKIGGEIMKFIQEKAIEESVHLGKTRGNFPNFKGSMWEKKGYKNMRNATLTTVAPTGSLSVMADCSSGIEPIFALAYTRYGLGSNANNKEKMFYINNRLEQALKDNWVYSKELMEKIIDKGSIKELDEIPDEVKNVFVTAMDIEPEYHVRMQAEFQKYVDSAITKTINLPSNATMKDVEDAYLLAYKLNCKGITVYRDQSRHEQALTVGKRSNITKENK